MFLIDIFKINLELQKSFMKYINYFLIVIGSVISFYANNTDDQNTYLLILGIVLLMIGIYRISRTIPSKNERDRYNETNTEDEV